MQTSPWMAGAGSLILSVVFLAILLRQGSRLPVDRPNDRSLHSKAVPRAGGLALVPAACAGWLVAPAYPWLIACLTLVLAAVSFLDDRRGLPVGLRMAVHVAVAAAFAYGLGANTDWLTIAVVILVITWSINLYNFMDGADGLAGGMALFGFGCLGIAAWLKGDLALAAINLSVAGSAAGFLFFNFPPARIFLGDAGSVPLGFLAAALGWSGFQSQLWHWWFPALVFSPFLVDATVTLCRRALQGQRVWQAHREHYYQRLVRMGWSHAKTAAIEYALMAAAAASAILLLFADAKAQWMAIGFWIVVYAGCMMSIDRRWQNTEGRGRE